MGLKNDAFCYSLGKNPRTPPPNCREKMQGSPNKPRTPPLESGTPAHFHWTVPSILGKDS